MNTSPKKQYWFIKKKIGFGWTPARWEGWVVTGLYVVGVVFLAHSLVQETSSKQEMVLFFAGMILLTMLLIVITIQFGEPLIKKK